MDVREKKKENLLKEITAESISKLGKEIDIQVQDTQTVPNKMNPKRSTSRNIIIKMVKKKKKIKDKETILKVTREKQQNTLFFFRCIQKVFQDTFHAGQKTSLNKFWKTEIISSTFADDRMRLEIN